MVGGIATDSETSQVNQGREDEAVDAGTALGRQPGARLAPLPSRPPLAEVNGKAEVERLAAFRRPGTTAPATRRLPGLTYSSLGKPVLDRVGALILGLLALPLVAMIAIVIRATLGSPVLYTQERVGRHGKRFRIYKFRTMRPDRRRGQRPFAGVDRRRRHKTTEDPRHTAVGRFLRRRSLDELPQLWNVLRGEMSLVGPRPELPTVVAGYRRWQHDRHLCKPGLTGLWQVSARNHGDGSLMCEHTEVDLEYVRSISLRADLKILCKTLGVLGGGE